MKFTIKRLPLLAFLLFFLAGCRGAAEYVSEAAPTPGAGQEIPAAEAAETTLPPPTSEAKPIAQPGAVGLGDAYFPDEGNGGYDVAHYDITLAADMEAREINAVVTIEATATQPLSAFNLDFTSFDISEITVDGQTVSFEHNEDELTITPAEPLAEGREFTVRIAYSGEPRPSRDLADGIPTGWFWGEDSAFVISEPFGAQTWYPVNDSPLDKATYSFEFTVPSHLVAAANGLPLETIENGNLTTYIWEAGDPMASYLATVSIDDFIVQTTETAGGLPVINFFPAGRAERLSGVFAPAEEMITLFSDLFGPYPFESFGAIVLDNPAGFALETQTRPTYAPNLAREEVIAHELAHQWFGDSVSLKEWDDMWLKEGFATYAEWLWAEHKEGRDALDALASAAYAAMSSAAASDDYNLPGRPPKEDLYNAGVYEGGAVILHALRLQVGDDALFKILQTYFHRYQNGNASTEDFIAVAEEVSGQDLADFFDAWLYSTNLPELDIDHS